MTRMLASFALVALIAAGMTLAGCNKRHKGTHTSRTATSSAPVADATKAATQAVTDASKATAKALTVASKATTQAVTDAAKTTTQAVTDAEKATTKAITNAATEAAGKASDMTDAAVKEVKSTTAPTVP